MFTKTQNDNKDPCIQMPFKLRNLITITETAFARTNHKNSNTIHENHPKLNEINVNHMFMGIFNTLNTNYSLI